MAGRILPLGIQDFADIRERGYVYVDKTARVHGLITGSGKPFFLSRPRRFGKSLLCSTLAAIFEGRRDLFGEIVGRPALAIDSLDWVWKKHPVIRLDLSAGAYTTNGLGGLYSVLSRELKRTAGRHGLTVDDSDHINQFANLIEKACDKAGEKAVVIIDEYDAPLLDTIVMPEFHAAIRNYLKSFYGILKSYDEYLRFVFITGITKFSKVSVFSELNHLDDLTLNPNYADICGLTQEEIEQNFEPEIVGILENTGKSREEYMDELRLYYNGYRFSKKPLKVYNSFGLLNHFNKGGEFLPYWYETGTPSFLVKLIAERKINILNMSDIAVGYSDFGKYNIDDLKAEPLLYQSGYLTITDYNEEGALFSLDFPNVEVESCFAKSLVDQYLLASNVTAGALNTKLLRAALKGDVDGMINAMRSFFSEIPYDIIKESENYYETVTHLIFKILGFDCRSEVRIAAGRIDTLVETKNYVYCFEFKLDKTADEAVEQIDKKDYLLPWKGSGKKLFKIGVSFDREKRNIGEWKHEVVEGRG